MKQKPGRFAGVAGITAISLGALLAAKTVADAMGRISLGGKVVLVTGGSRGLGLIMARQLAEAGARVVICGRSESSLQSASDDLTSRTVKHLALPCDVTDRQQVDHMIEKIRNEVGSVDLLINNAGIIQAGPIESTVKEDYESAMQVHFWGPFNVINAVLPHMIEKRSGRIVNIVSIGGKISAPHLLPYNTSKYALSGFSEGLAAELSRYNIKVITIYPGLMRTGSPRNIDVKGQHKKEYAWFKTLSSLPFLSMSADRAARHILIAVQQGRRTRILTVPARIAVAAHGIAPGLTISLLEWVNSLLPEGHEDKSMQKGFESESSLSRSVLTKKTDAAAERNLEK